MHSSLRVCRCGLLVTQLSWLFLVECLIRADAPVRLDVKCMLAKFDSWFTAAGVSCLLTLAQPPQRQLCVASTSSGLLCLVLPLDVKGGLDRKRWKGGPRYVRRTAGMCRSKALSVFCLAAHDLEVETGNWCRVRDTATGRMRFMPVSRDRRLCGFCWDVVGDELVCSCPSYAAVRERHQQLFEVLGGWQNVVDGTVTAEQFGAFMHQDQLRVASILHDCSHAGGLTHGSAWPPSDLAFADCVKMVYI
jgi:hypothetical protein